jgi:uncharacterized membrane protein YqiK
MDKKAQGMSLNVIIVAVLVLIILVVLVLIFTGKLKMFGSGTSDTQSKYTGKGKPVCSVPGTNNQCMDQAQCKQQGGSWSSPPADGYEDCSYGGCCSL